MSCVRTGREGNISLVKCVLYHHGTCLRNLLGRTLACWKPWKDRIWAFLFHQENTSKTEHRHTCTENKTRTYDKEIFSFLSVAHVDQFLLNQETVITLITGYCSSRVDFWWFLFYRTRVGSLRMLVTNSLAHSMTHWLLFSKLDWCGPGVWRWQLKTCWGCYCCWCW